MCGESVLVAVQQPAEIAAVDVCQPLRGNGECLISVLCLKCVHRTAAVTVGGTAESMQGDRRVCGVSIFPASLDPKGKRDGS